MWQLTPYIVTTWPATKSNHSIDYFLGNNGGSPIFYKINPPWVILTACPSLSILHIFFSFLCLSISTHHTLPLAFLQGDQNMFSLNCWCEMVSKLHTVLEARERCQQFRAPEAFCDSRSSLYSNWKESILSLTP